MPTVREQMEAARKEGYSDDEISQRFSTLGFKRADLDTEYGAALSTAKARKATEGAVRSVVTDTMQYGLDTAGLTGLVLDPEKARQRDEDEARRGSVKPLPAAPVQTAQPGGILATGRDPLAERKAREVQGGRGLPSYNRQELKWNPVTNIVGLTQGVFDATPEGVDKSMRAAQKDLGERKRMDYHEAAQVDAAENLASPFLLFLEAVGPRYVDRQNETALSAARKSGKNLTEGLAGGALSALEAIGQGDVEGVLAKPVSLASIAYPGAGLVAKSFPRTTAALKKGGSAVAEVASRAGEAVHRGAAANIPGTRVSPLVLRAVGDMVDTALGGLLTAEGRASVKRTLADGLHQADPRATALAEAIVQDPQNAASSIKQDLERLARRAAADKGGPALNPEIMGVKDDVVIPPSAAELDAAKTTAASMDDAFAAPDTDPIPFVRDDGTTIDLLREDAEAMRYLMSVPETHPALRAAAQRALDAIEAAPRQPVSPPKSIQPAPLSPAGPEIRVDGVTYTAAEAIDNIAALEARVAAGKSAGLRDLGAERRLADFREAADESGRWQTAGKADDTVRLAEDASSPLAQAAVSRLGELGVDLPPDVLAGTPGRATEVRAVPEVSTVVPSEPFASSASVDSAIPIGLWRSRLREVAGDVVDNIRDQVAKLDPDLAARLKESGRSIEDEILTAAAGPMALEINSLLRNRPFRDKVSRAVAASMRVADPKRFATQLSDTVSEALGKSFAGEAPLGAVVMDPVIAPHWDAAVTAAIDGAKAADLIRGAVATVSEDLGRELEKTAVTRGIAAESGRARTAADVVKQVQDGDLLPQILGKDVNPRSMAEEMIRLAPDDAKVQSAARVIAGYEPLDAKLLGAEGWAKPSFKSSLEMHARAREAFYSDDVLSNIIRMQKMSYVPRNAKAILNNYASNEALQMSNRVSPTSTLLRLARAWKYEQFLKGVGTAADSDLFRAIQRTGIVDSNRLAQDIGVMRGFVDMGSEVPGIALVNKVLQAGFEMGDQVFKLDEIMTNIKDVQGYLKALRPGKTFQLPAGSKLLEFGKTADGAITVRNLHAVKKEAPRVRTGDGLLDAVAEVSADSPRRKVIDYTRIPGGLQRLKSGPFRGMGSGFATWMAGAIDIPFIKKGLFHASMADPLNMITNDPGILRMLRQRDVAIATKRALLAGVAGSSEQTDPFAQKLGSIFNYGASESRPTVSRMISQDTAASFDLRGVDYLGPTKLITRVGVSMGLALASALETGDLRTARNLVEHMKKDGADPKLWSAYTRALYRDASGQIGSVSDVLDLVALSGSTILDTWESIKATEEAGKVAYLPAVLDYMLTPMIGSTAASLASGVSEGLREAAGGSAPSKSRANTLSDNPTDSQSFLRWAIQHITGKGWRERSVRDADVGTPYSLYSKLRKEWKAALRVREEKAAGEGTIKLGETKGATGTTMAGERRIDQAEELGFLVDDALFEMFGEFEDKATKRFEKDATPMYKKPKPKAAK